MSRLNRCFGPATALWLCTASRSIGRTKGGSLSSLTQGLSSSMSTLTTFLQSTVAHVRRRYWQLGPERSVGSHPPPDGCPPSAPAGGRRSTAWRASLRGGLALRDVVIVSADVV